MMEIVKKGMFVSFIYLMAIASTLLISNRVTELDHASTNTNQGLTIKLAR